MPLQAHVRMVPRWVPVAIALAAILAGAVLEIAWGQTPPVPGMEGLSSDERAFVERNPERWRRMSPEERARLRERIQQMSPEERERFRRERRADDPPR